MLLDEAAIRIAAASSDTLHARYAALRQVEDERIDIGNADNGGEPIDAGNAELRLGHGGHDGHRDE